MTKKASPAITSKTTTTGKTTRMGGAAAARSKKDTTVGAVGKRGTSIADGEDNMASNHPADDGILLSADECKTLKKIVFGNHQSVLDPLFLKVAQKELNSINKIFARNIELCLYDIGPTKKSCQEIIRENMKDYKGLAKATAVGYDSPSKKFKDLIGPYNHLQ